MLTTLTARSAKLTPLGKTLEQVIGEGDRRHDEARRAREAALDARRSREGARARSTSAFRRLKDAAKQAELTTQKAIGPDGELQKHREAVQHLSSQALQTQATLDTLKKERAALEELRGQLRDGEGEVKQATTQASTAEGRARSDPRDRHVADAGLRQDSRNLARSARGHDRRHDDRQGHREEARCRSRSSTS